MIADRRLLTDLIERDLNKKFVLLSGPRQVGKTTLAQQIIEKHHGKYYLYDDMEQRQSILQREYIADKWVCLDELHKFSRWKSHIKSVFDLHHKNLHVLITGSARLDVYQKSGDSLFGRYYLHHLHPFSVGEFTHKSFPALPENVLEPDSEEFDIEPLLRFSGFPEPFFAQSETELRRWQTMRRQLLIKEDLRDISQVHLLDLIEQLMLCLTDRIGSLFSYNSIAEDIQVGTPTVQNWMQLLERLFLIFKITPYSKNIIRSLKKQPKYFFYDWASLKNEGFRFENFVASHLFKAAQQWQDMGYADLDLHFIRDRDSREVDFLMVKDRKPWFLVECKVADTQLSPALLYFSQRLGVPAIQLVQKRGVCERRGNTLVVSAGRWLRFLG